MPNNEIPNPVPARWHTGKLITIAVVFGAIVTSGMLSLRGCRTKPIERPQTSPVQGVGAAP